MSFIFPTDSYCKGVARERTAGSASMDTIPQICLVLSLGSRYPSPPPNWYLPCANKAKENTVHISTSTDYTIQVKSTIPQKFCSCIKFWQIMKSAKLQGVLAPLSSPRVLPQATGHRVDIALQLALPVFCAVPPSPHHKCNSHVAVSPPTYNCLATSLPIQQSLLIN